MFADFLTTYYTDGSRNPHSSSNPKGAFAVICSDHANLCSTSFMPLAKRHSLFVKVLGRYPRYNERSRRFIRWAVTNGWREVPAAPRRVPHFHINLLPEARKMATTRALMSAYLSYLYRCGEKHVYGQIVTFESRRGEKMFERYGFNVYEPRPRSRSTKRSIRSRFISAP